MQESSREPLSERLRRPAGIFLLSLVLTFVAMSVESGTDSEVAQVIAQLILIATFVAFVGSLVLIIWRLIR